jgi:hypothetical protein
MSQPFVPFVYRPRPYDPNIGGFGGQRASFNIYDETSINLTRGMVIGAGEKRWRIEVNSDNKLSIAYSSDGGGTFALKMRVSPD